MKKLESMLNYVNTAPIWNYGAALVETRAVLLGVKEDEWGWFSALTALAATYVWMGYQDFKGYKGLKTTLENGWNAEEVDKFVNRKPGLLSKYIAKRAARHAGYSTRFDKLYR